MKYCSKCLSTKPIKEFGKDSHRPDGITLNCLACRRAYFKNHYSQNREKVNSKTKARYHDNPEKAMERGRKWQSENREKVREKSKRWRESNLEKAREQARLGSNRRRARKRGAITDSYTEASVIQAYGTLCHLCNDEIDLNAPRRCGDPGWEKSLHIDHVLELCLGGNDTLENVRPSHAVCNIRKPRTKKL